MADVDPEHGRGQTHLGIGGQRMAEPVVVEGPRRQLSCRIDQVLEGTDLSADPQARYVFDGEEQVLSIVNGDAGAKAQRLPDLTVGVQQAAFELEPVHPATRQGVDQLIVVVVRVQQVAQRRSPARLLPAAGQAPVTDDLPFQVGEQKSLQLSAGPLAKPYSRSRRPQRPERNRTAGTHGV